MKKENVQLIRNAFGSILRADYISIYELDQLKQLDDYYVDFFNNVPRVLQSQDNFINGRRGAGKTTLLMRAYYECLKTISPNVKEKSGVFGTKRILPIYIDLSQCKDIFDNSDIEIFERNFIIKLVEEFRRQLDSIFIEEKIKLLKSNFAELETFDEALNLIKEGLLVKKTNLVEKEACEEKDESEIEAGLSIKSSSINAGKSKHRNVKIERENEFVKCCSVQSLLGCLGQIRRKSELDAIYVFIDEFSDLSNDEQARFSAILKKLLGSKNNIYFKVGTITDRYYFGENILIGRDIYPISLDLCDFVEKYGGIVAASKKLEEYTRELIEKRLISYAPGVNFSDVFKTENKEIIARISREAMGVPRTIGLILQNALSQAEAKNDSFIQLVEINAGIREARKTYFRQFQGAVQKKVIPGFYMDMWNSLLKRALDEKGKNFDRPASHFMIDPLRKKYLNVFCENFMVHCLEDSRASKYGGNYVLYAIDYDVCSDNNILYAQEKDQFTAVRFIYDSVFQAYDGYFMKERIKSYKCPICSKIYEESEVAQSRVKRCFDCDEILEEIIHKDVPITDGNYTELEVKILGIIATLNRDEAMTAAEIGDAVGCSFQKVALWCSRVLKKKDLIEIEKREGKNYYFDKIDDAD